MIHLSACRLENSFFDAYTFRFLAALDLRAEFLAAFLELACKY